MGLFFFFKEMKMYDLCIQPYFFPGHPGFQTHLLKVYPYLLV